jgi:hypothetical protein
MIERDPRLSEARPNALVFRQNVTIGPRWFFAGAMARSNHELRTMFLRSAL